MGSPPQPERVPARTPEARGMVHAARGTYHPQSGPLSEAHAQAAHDAQPGAHAESAPAPRAVGQGIGGAPAHVSALAAFPSVGPRCQGYGHQQSGRDGHADSHAHRYDSSLRAVACSTRRACVLGAGSSCRSENAGAIDSDYQIVSTWGYDRIRWSLVTSGAPMVSAVAMMMRSAGSG